MPFSGLTAILNDVWDAINHRLRVDSSGSTVTVTGLDTRFGQSLTATGQTATVALNAAGAVLVDVSGTWTSTVGLTIEVTDDPTLVSGWQNVAYLLRQADFGILVANLASGSIGTYFTPGVGWTGVRARARGTWTGTAVVQINAAPLTFQPLVFTQSVAGAGFGDGVSTASQSVPTGGSQQNILYHRVLRYAKVGTASADLVRTPAAFKSATASASGNTAVWTPAAGKKFRLMRFCLGMTGDAKQSVAGRITASFQDAAADMGLSFPVIVPAAAAGNGNLWQSGWIDLGNGFLSAAANNALNLNLSAALTGGAAYAIAAGTEE